METKKNKSRLRLGILAIILVLLLTIGAVAVVSIVNYIGTATITTQTTTVAKWGYTLTADATALLFGTNYDSVNHNFATKVDNGGVIVSSHSGSNVVAPGTKGEANIFTINGSAKVDARLIITVSEDFKTIHLTDGEDTDYYPIKWKINDREITVSNNAVNASEFAKAIAEALNQGSLPSGITAIANNNVVTVDLPATNSKIDNFQLKISWEWALRTLKQGTSDTYCDAEDTILGRIAQLGGATGDYSSYSQSSWQIALDISANVEQVQ